MMTILDQIIVDKKKEVEQQKKTVSIKELEQKPLFKRNTLSLKRKLESSSFGFISEFKRKSPSKGIINDKVTVGEVVKGYEKAGTYAVSVLTDTPYFGGSLQDLEQARNILSVPLLRKDFTVDEYQLYEAKAFGADLILLIAAVLTKKEVEHLSKKAHELGLEVLLELHEERELATLCNTVDLIGINNRNLKTFDVDIENSLKMAKKIPDSFLKVSESGLSSPTVVAEFIKKGFKGFLVGETFMKSDDPGQTCANFIADVNKEIKHG